uniref:T-complex protein 1 subunit eta n=1 Tax=Oryzias sinensis TaxID=183150 RepID=A0A8C7XQB3_9TELE
MQPTPVILLKEGTDSSQGIPQLVSNINACQVIAEAVRTTLGPRGMDKLMVDARGKATISNDGATILKLLDVVHPAAKTLVDIARSQDAEVGDGTTSVTLLAAEFLRQLKPFVEESLHPQTIIRAFRTATNLAVSKIKEIAVSVKKDDKQEQRQLLEKCAATALNSKLIAGQKEFFSKMVVDAVMSLDELLSLKMIGIKKVQGGALEDSQLVSGVAFKKTFSYAGFEMQPKRYENPKIALLNVELELKAEKDNAEVRVKSVEEYQAIVDAEWNILYDKLEKIYQSGAKVVLSKLPIGDVATQYFADRDLFCAGRVQEEDLKRTMMACGGSIQTSVGALTEDVLGLCEVFEEVQVGGERYNFFKGCPKAKTCTIILRGGAEQFTEETERSLHDAIMIVRRAIKVSWSRRDISCGNLPCVSDHGRKREVIAQERFNTWIKLLVQHKVCKHFLIQNSERAHKTAEQPSLLLPRASPLARPRQRLLPSPHFLHDNHNHKRLKEVRGMRKYSYVVLRTSTFDSFSIV